MNESAWERRPVVLVVDDEDTVRDFTKHMLEAEGFEVLTAQNSVEALHIGAAFRGTIDLLMTDVLMKIFQNGIELAHCFNVLRPETHVLLISGAAPDAYLNGKVDGWPFLPKPFDRRMLLNAVEALIPQAHHANSKSLTAA